MAHYDSDASTLVDDEGRRRSRRRTTSRSPSQDRHDSRQPYGDQDYYGYSSYSATGKDDKSKYATIGKVVLAAGILGVILHKWQKQKHEQREREYRHRKRKDFERQKRARRKEEERRDREEERADDESPPPVARRIEYRPLEQTRSRSTSSSRSRRRIEEPGGRSARRQRDHDDGRQYDDGRRARSRAE